MNIEVRKSLEKQLAESILSKIESIDFSKNPLDNLNTRNYYLRFFNSIGIKDSFKLIDEVINKRVNRDLIIEILIDKYFSKLSDDDINMRLLFAKSKGKMEIPKSHIKDFNDFIKRKS